MSVLERVYVRVNMFLKIFLIHGHSSASRSSYTYHAVVHADPQRPHDLSWPWTCSMLMQTNPSPTPRPYPTARWTRPRPTAPPQSPDPQHKQPRTERTIYHFILFLLADHWVLLIVPQFNSVTDHLFISTNLDSFIISRFFLISRCRTGAFFFF